MKSFRNDVHNLSHSMHVQIKIYWKFYHGIVHVYIANEGCHIRMIFNTTFSTITVISLLSILLMEETWVNQETTDLSQVTDKLYRINLYLVHLTTSWNHTVKFS